MSGSTSDRERAGDDTLTGSAATTPPTLRAAVREYFAMLASELRSHAPNGNRTRWRTAPDSTERQRHYGHISAILLGHGLPALRHHHPRAGAPAGARHAVADYLRNHPEILRLMEDNVFRPEPEWDFKGTTLLGSLVEPPSGDAHGLDGTDGTATPLSGTDFLVGEQRNRSLAHAGERFVFGFESQRLQALGLHKYAAALEHSARELGDHAGYDIQSWQADGSELLIRVKTTRFGPQTPFYLSEHELAVARAHGNRYAIYRVFDFGPQPRLFVVSGGIEHRCQLRPSVHRAVLR